MIADVAGFDLYLPREWRSDSPNTGLYHFHKALTDVATLRVLVSEDLVETGYGRILIHRCTLLSKLSDARLNLRNTTPRHGQIASTS
jgi:hypothetical protein